MTGTKRKASDGKSEDSPTNKARRTSSPVQPRQYRFDFNRLSSVSYMNYRLENDYNRYVHFIEHALSGNKAREAAEIVQKRLDGMQEVMDRASKQIKEQEDELETELYHFCEARRATKHWWKEGNILTLSLHQIQDAFDDQPPDSAEDLYWYLRKALESDLLRLQDERNRDDEDLQEDHVDNLIYVFRTLFELPGGPYFTIHAYVFYRSILRSTSLRIRSLAKRVLDKFDEWLDRAGGWPCWDESETRSYLDFAGLARGLREAEIYFGGSVLETYEVRLRQKQSKCYHIDSAPLLDVLWKEAWGEVRGNVMCTIGTVLPAELVDLIAEYALIAEELPTERDVYDCRNRVEACRDDQLCAIMA